MPYAISDGVLMFSVFVSKSSVYTKSVTYNYSKCFPTLLAFNYVFMLSSCHVEI